MCNTVKPSSRRLGSIRPRCARPCCVSCCVSMRRVAQPDRPSRQTGLTSHNIFSSTARHAGGVHDAPPADGSAALAMVVSGEPDGGQHHYAPLVGKAQQQVCVPLCSQLGHRVVCMYSSVYARTSTRSRCQTRSSHLVPLLFRCQRRAMSSRALALCTPDQQRQSELLFRVSLLHSNNTRLPLRPLLPSLFSYMT